MTNIAYIMPRYDSFYGGQKSVLTLVENLDERINPIIVTTKEGKLSKNFRKKGIQVKILPIEKVVNVFGKTISGYNILKKLKVILALLKYNIKLIKWIKSKKIDMVHANNIRAVLYSGLAARIAGIPLVWYIRNDSQPGKLLRKLGLKLPSKIITISYGVREIFSKKELKRYDSKFINIYTGFNIDNFERNSLLRDRLRNNLYLEDAFIVGLVGSIVPRKGHDLLIKAAEDIIAYNNDVHFLIVGGVTEGYKRYKKNLISNIDQGLQSHFHWTGYKSNISGYYSCMDMLVLPSRSEGLPRTVIEGLGAGLPVVASDVGGTKEIITSKELGIVFEKDNVEEFVEAVTEIIKNYSYYEGNFETRTNYVKKNFSVHSYVTSYENEVENII